MQLEHVAGNQRVQDPGPSPKLIFTLVMLVTPVHRARAGAPG